MKIVHPLISEIINLSNESKVNILVIENQKLFTSILTELYGQINNCKGEFVFSIDNSPKEISKNIEIITQFIPFEINKKTLIGKLLKKMDTIAQGEDFLIKTKELYLFISEYAKILSEEIDHDIDFIYEYDISNILKTIDFKFKEDYESLAEKIIDYMLLVREFDSEKCFVLLNLRNYISDEEIDDFYKTILYNKLKVLIISANDYEHSDYESKIVIDSDLCEF